jgi:protein LTV1
MIEKLTQIAFLRPSRDETTLQAQDASTKTLDVCGIIPPRIRTRALTANARSDKKTATKYQLFHRSQNDPLIHDPEADDRVLYQVTGPAPAVSSSQHTPGNLAELENEFRSEELRTNEGEAANYGIFFDDSKYDYMQHLRELGTGSGGAHFVEAAPAKSKGKGKAMKLEDALKDISLDDSRSECPGGSVYNFELASTYAQSTASSYVRKPTYQDQQDIPDAIAGFQPDMDPRLREALEALNDDAYVDNGDAEDVFGELTKGPEELGPGEWEDTLFDQQQDDDGWESDVTEKALPQGQAPDAESSEGETVRSSTQDKDYEQLPDHNLPVPDTQSEDRGWLREFAEYKKDSKVAKAPAAAPAAGDASERRTAASTLFTIGGTPIRRKKRKGALTNPSTYSMTSSSLARTEGLRLLDDRFERIEALYSVGEEGGGYEADETSSMVSGMTGFSSQAPSLVSGSGRSRNAEPPLRSDFDEVMDDFLAGWQDRSAQAKRKGAKGKRGKNGNEAIGMRMLDEVRQGLGPARVTASNS